MSVSKSFVFDDGANYTFDTDKIELVSGKAQLKLTDLSGQSFNQPFDSDTGFVYDSDKAEFTGGKVQQKDQRPTDATFGANYDTDIDGNWGDGVLTGTATGGAAVSGEKLDLTHDDIRSVDYDAVGNADMQQTGCIRFKITPNYTSPTSVYYIFDIGTGSHSKNKITFYQIPDKTTYLTIHNETNGRILIIGGGVWNTIAGQEYEIEIDFDITNGETRYFIDGIQQGATSTATGIRDNDIVDFRIGGIRSANGRSNYFIDDFVVFSTVQHTANYTPGYTISDNIYAATNVTLPEMHYTGAGTIQTIDSMTTTEMGTPRYTIQIGRSGDYLYWDSSAWVTSDGTYAQANDITTFNTNASTIDIEGEVYGQFKISFSDSNIISDVSDLTATVTGQIYPVDSPSIKNLVAISAQGIESIEITENGTVTDYMKYTVMVESVEKFWNGSSWAVSSGFLESNTKTEIQDNIAVLDLSAGYDVYIISYLHSATGIASPDVSQIDVVYDFYGGGPVRPILCVVWGYIHDITDEPSQSIAIKITAENNANYHDETLVTTTPKNVGIDSQGYWEIPLFKTGELDPAIEYNFDFKGTKFHLSEMRTVPDEISTNYLKLV